MHRFVSLILISTLTILSAGCLTDNPFSAADGNICLLTPGEGFPIYGGEGDYSVFACDEMPGIPANYTFGSVTILPGNATSPHRLTGSSEFVCVIGGEAEIRCGNTTVTAREGEVVILPDGVLQSIAAIGDAELRYIDVIQPPFSEVNHVTGADLATIPALPDGVPIVIPDPRGGIEWNIGSDMMIYTIANPVLMPKKNMLIDYSVAYAELLPGGSADTNCLTGASELIYVIEGEIAVFSPEGYVIRVPAGRAAWIAPDQAKGYRNVGEVDATMLSFVDPPWTLDMIVAVE
ncbi:cupin domain-containing protein [Methanogenium marinum]|uniref:Cupin domain-containing protein n=1 Tax=Methanogenium marinum TaxID=348610 RepID=A0A9Q4PYD4_9EURY|nr:cupin domain-containing protein [Methanogenium marinum]MDE4907707.1 cupin domain-containing protein [Methanogenium marinum]